MPKISIIVPIYNVEKYINQCINSILEQTFTDFELILIDDGSPDKCGKICEEYAKKDSRIHVIHQNNHGLSAARNVGIDWAFANSNSEWITFIDSDDWVHPDYLRLLYNASTSTYAKNSVCRSFAVRDNAIPDIIIKASSIDMDPEQFWCQNRVFSSSAWGKLYIKDLFKNTRYPVGRIHEDEFITYKILCSSPCITLLDSPLYFYRIRANSITSKFNYQRLDVLDAFKEQYDYFSSLGFYKAARISVQLILDATCNYIKETGQKPKEFAQINNNLRKSLRNDLAFYKNNTDIPYSKKLSYYRVAYPFIEPIWDILKFACRLINKIKSKGVI